MTSITPLLWRHYYNRTCGWIISLAATVLLVRQTPLSAALTVWMIAGSMRKPYVTRNILPFPSCLSFVLPLPLPLPLSPLPYPPLFFRCSAIMTPLSLLWRRYPLYYDVTTLSIMMSLTPLLWRHLPRYYGVTYPATMTSLTPLLWCHYPRYYDVTNPATMTSLTPLLWCHLPRYFDVTNPATMTSLTPLLWRH